MFNCKVILWDVDDVLIRLPDYYSQELERKGYEKVEENLKNYYQQDNDYSCTEGKAEAREVILPYLLAFGWDKTSEEYFKEQFAFEGQYLDQELMALICRLRQTGTQCYLCTDQEQNRANFLLRELNFINLFDGYFISCQIGYRKCQEPFWQTVLSNLSEFKPEEILFIDDRQNNLDMATQFGLQTLLFSDREQLKHILF